MPPFLPQPPLDAAGAAGVHRFLDVALAAVAVACEPWALALVAVALYSWLEREVRGVVAAAAPLVAALLAGSGLAFVAHAAWAAPRAVGAEGLAPVLHDLLPGAQILALATFVTYTLLVYRWRGLPVLLLAAAGVAARVHAGPRWGPDLAGGGLVGALLAVAAYALTLRAFPRGHLAARRSPREQAAGRSP